MIPDLKIQKYNGFVTSYSRSANLFPKFQQALASRTRKKRSTIVLVVGEPGSGKSYQAISFCRILCGFKKTSKHTIALDKNGLRKDRFKIVQVCFTLQEYMKALKNLKLGDPIMFDEPQYALSKRDWYQDVNKALVKTIQSQRFLCHPIFLPIINQSLLDKTIRNYLIQYLVVMEDRGKGSIYTVAPSHFQDKTRTTFFCKFEYGMLDYDYCKTDSCLGCKKLGYAKPEDPNLPEDETFCMLFRAQYERKKSALQNQRYESTIIEAQEVENRELADVQIERIVMENLQDALKDDGDTKVFNAPRIRLLLRRKGIHLKNWKLYKIKDNLDLLHPEYAKE